MREAWRVQWEQGERLGRVDGRKMQPVLDDEDF